MDYQVLKAQLEDGQRQNLYIFTGEERELIRRYIKKIDPEAKEISSFKEAAIRMQNVGLFTKKDGDTYVIYNDETVQDMDIKQIVHMIGSDTVILIYDKIDGRTKFFKSASSFIFEFPKLGVDTLRKYVQSQLDELEDYEASALVRMCNNDLARIDMECHKLSFLGRDVTAADIRDLVVRTAEDVIFDMIKAVAKKDVEKAYLYLSDLLERKESPVKIVSLIYTQFRNISLVQAYSNLSNADVASKTGLSSGQIFYVRELTNFFSLDDLRYNLIDAQQAEVNIKTGRFDQHVALDDLLLKILR